jgi:GTPase involved in cell partitioning and DNA repair
MELDKDLKLQFQQEVKQLLILQMEISYYENKLRRKRRIIMLQKQ